MIVYNIVVYSVLWHNRVTKESVFTPQTLFDSTTVKFSLVKRTQMTYKWLVDCTKSRASIHHPFVSFFFWWEFLDVSCLFICQCFVTPSIRLFSYISWFFTLFPLVNWNGFLWCQIRTSTKGLSIPSVPHIGCVLLRFHTLSSVRSSLKSQTRWYIFVTLICRPSSYTLIIRSLHKILFCRN